jgi:hypothetical protein
MYVIRKTDLSIAAKWVDLSDLRVLEPRLLFRADLDSNELRGEKKYLKSWQNMS